MAGTTLRLNMPTTAEKHNFLLNRNLPFQHILESIYRETDGKDLATILRELEATEREVLFELVKVQATGQRVIKLTKFQYNMARDVLFVQLQGIDVYEGTDKDFVKTAGDEITFNYNLTEEYEVLIVLAGTISSESFGNDIYNSLNQFRQLVDTPDSYYGQAGRYVQVNDSETGLVFKTVKASNDLVKLEMTFDLAENEYAEEWIPFIKSGIIKGIKVTPADGYEGNITMSMWVKPNGEWIYHSGQVTNVLWDIMDIPHVDESGQDAVYFKLYNQGQASTFKVQIFVVL